MEIITIRAMIEVIKAGIRTSFQDNGRFGFRAYGVPISGPMDSIAAKECKNLLQIAPNSPLLECTLQGPTLLFKKATTICFVGAAFKLSLNNHKISSRTLVKVNKGDILNIGNAQSGVYGYLGFLHEPILEEKLNSICYYNSICSNNLLIKGFQFQLGSYNKPLKNTLINSRISHSKKVLQIPAYKGTEFDNLTEIVKHALLNSSFEISKNFNRMGVQLCTKSELSAKEIVTSAVQPGTVQLTPSGKLILLMKDCQTTGGYARVLHLPEVAQCLIAQMRPSTQFKFILL